MMLLQTNLAMTTGERAQRFAANASGALQSRKVLASEVAAVAVESVDSWGASLALAACGAGAGVVAVAAASGKLRCCGGSGEAEDCPGGN